MTLAGQKHDVAVGLGDGSRELFPVADGPRSGIRERFAKGLWGVAKGTQSEVSVETYLVCCQPP
jgi:hypothetical protein